MLLQKPTLSRDQIVFVFAGDLWIVGRNGGEARRLTAGPGTETNPHFSPNGSMIAFTGEYDGNVDVYVVPAAGGVPKRLTFHPDADRAVGWTPDGKNVLFLSGRYTPTRNNRLYTISVEGGFPAEIPLPLAEDGAFSPDGTHLAYVPTAQWQAAWKRYRGGQTKPIWIATLADSSVEPLPQDGANNFNPLWVDSTIYFLSDRSGPVSLFAYDTVARKVSQVLANDGLDFKSASAGPGGIVYEQFGSIHLFDFGTRQSKKVEIQLHGDLPEVRARFQKLEPKHVRASRISPTGARAVFQARGEILTVPAEKGDIRNLTRTPADAERDPAWSPDGKWIAYFSDESGEYELHLRGQSSSGEVRKINLGTPPSFFYAPVWSPDSKKIAYTDKRLNIWYVEIEAAKPVRVDADTYDMPFHAPPPAWSPDGRWLAYSKQLRSHLHAIFVYSLETGKSDRITDGMSDATFPVFDKTGKYLYFCASTDAGLTSGWLDLSSMDRPVTRNIYLMVLQKDLPSPLAPESDEEQAEKTKPDDKKGAISADKGKESEKPKDKDADKEKGKDEAGKEPAAVRIDFENIGQRILSLPLPARNYRSLATGKTNTLFYLEGPPVDSPPNESASAEFTLHKFDLSKRKSEKLVEGLKASDSSATGDLTYFNPFSVSDNGEKLLYQKGAQWFIVPTDSPPKAGDGALKFENIEIWIDPPAMWRQMYREAWRIERDFLYDPGLHGLDLKAAEARYEKYLPGLASRADLNYLFEEMLGELTLGHVFVMGGEMPEVKRTRSGLLGADYRIEKGRYRFTRVYDGENWNPQLRAPLTQPGVNVAAGEYLLAVNSRELAATDNLYRWFEATADRQTVLRVGPNPDGTGAREVTVVPVDSEKSLRGLAWIEDNRRKVDQLSQGRVAYVHLPNTAGAGYLNFNRFYFAQVGREGAVIDERFNRGGYIADYIIDYLRRPLLSGWTTREGEDFTTPSSAIFGPKAMIINEFAGSGGDALPWMFRRLKIGPLVGKRTWGGLVGIYDYPELMDGGFVMAPRAAFYSPDGTWDVENHGVAPDVEIEFDPKAWREGRDPQLEKAVQVVLDELQKSPLQRLKKPAYPNYHR